MFKHSGAIVARSIGTGISRDGHERIELGDDADVMRNAGRVDGYDQIPNGWGVHDPAIRCREFVDHLTGTRSGDWRLSLEVEIQYHGTKFGAPAISKLSLRPMLNRFNPESMIRRDFPHKQEETRNVDDGHDVGVFTVVVGVVTLTALGFVASATLAAASPLRRIAS